MNNEGWNLEHSYTELPQIFYRNQNPKSAPTPQMYIFNHRLAETLGLNSDELSIAPEIFAGTILPHGAKPISQAYAGYQFGHFAMLGDGRAVVLGEQIAPDGRRFDIQLKGSGPTPFSRRGDGYAALLPMLREYIISEAMFYLGIPTTRSLAVALTGKDVYREKILQGAVLTRVASSHIRVGTFNYTVAFGTQEDTRLLVDYCIRRHFPKLENNENRFVLFLRSVAERQADLIAKWQLVGFIHGVMNTDNMTISGETIDYGPCAFMDIYNPNTVFSSIDTEGRYAYKNQSQMGAWNLSRFAESLLPLFHENQNKAVEMAEKEISHYWKYYNDNWLTGMKTKLGIIDNESEDASLVAELLDLMATHKLDYTNTFRSLCFPIKDSDSLMQIPKFVSWHTKWSNRLHQQPQSQHKIADAMKQHNPAVIPRNHHVEEALAAAESGDASAMHNLLGALRKPYEESERYSKPAIHTCSEYRTFCGT
ncbi:MAG: YdiU family protein [Defluviitaleaceae bacterium]|nr:YdiU family protein [Defluviitaleaceae bacterium]